MSTFINTNETTIKAKPEIVWQALTTSDNISTYMVNIKVVSDWQQGSSIVYTHYEKDGSITMWEGMQMIWTGVIEVLNPNQQFDVRYTDQSTGLVHESYTLEAINSVETKVTFIQELVSQKIADNYKEGNEYSLNALKSYLEKVN
jgi:uncharacterized protein YndB with AHSA1/START domain